MKLEFHLPSLLGIPDANEEIITEQEVKRAIFEHHYNDMVGDVKEKKKLNSIKEDDLSEVQPYFKDKSVENVRMAFKIRTEMVTEIPGNYKNKYRVKGTENGLNCLECDEDVIWTHSHCLTCLAWPEIREGLELTSLLCSSENCWWRG